tara:strand:- start:177 stop:413 length:237 start_codon:yes stop_codon:yes gene_type:complete
MTKEQINEKFFEGLFEQQMSEIDGHKLDKRDQDRTIMEAHEIITKLLFAWETGINKRYGDNHKITDKAINWLTKNSKI